MINMSNVELEDRKYVNVCRGDAFSSSIICSAGLAFASSHTYSRPGSRARPISLLPRYGTSSTKSVNRQHNLQIGKQGSISAWRPYGPYSFRDSTLVYAETVDVVRSKGHLTSMTELKPLIANKIREEIISSKGQLGNDLLELSKTKQMFADAGIGLWKAFRDIRRGRPFDSFIRELRREGYSSYAGRQWLEFIYGWAPTISGAFDTAGILAKEFKVGSIVTGTIHARQKLSKTTSSSYASYEAFCRTHARGYYQYTIRDPALMLISQLGLTNPLAIAWEATPFSFVFDWFVGVGDYVNRMDFALGLSDIYWQYACYQRSQVIATYFRHPVLALTFDTRPGIILNDSIRSQRDAPTNEVMNTFEGFKNPFVNGTVRLASSVALINQLRVRINRTRT